MIVSCTSMLCKMPDVAGGTLKLDTSHTFPAFVKLSCTGMISRLIELSG